MKKILVGLTMGVLLMIFTVCYACAQGPLGPVDGHRGTGIVGIEADHPLWLDLSHLTIDGNRMDAIHEIEVRSVKEGIRKRAEFQVASIELRELLAKDPVDMKAVGSGLKQISALRTDLEFSRIKTIEEIKAKLTSEERKKLREYLEAAHMRPASARDGMIGPGPCDQPPPAKKPLDEKRAPRTKERVR